MQQIIYTRFDELEDQLLDVMEDMETEGQTEELVLEYNRIAAELQQWQLCEPKKDKDLRALREVLSEIKSQEIMYGSETGSYYEYLLRERDILTSQIQQYEEEEEEEGRAAAA